MAIEAPVSKFRKNNLKLYIIGLIALGTWCLYDGYINQEWIEKHTDEQGNPETYLVFNQRAPYFTYGGALLIGGYLLYLSGKKVWADDENVYLPGGKKIGYSKITAIDKTHFESKGYFTISYEADGASRSVQLSDRKYDNLGLLLDHIIAKIS